MFSSVLPSTKKVVTYTEIFVPFAAARTTFESHVSPARIGIVSPCVFACSIIRAAASIETGEKNTSAPMFFAFATYAAKSDVPSGNVSNTTSIQSFLQPSIK